MYLIMTSLYPSEKVSEVTKMYLEAISKYPPDENVGTQLVPAAVKRTLQGIQTKAIVEAKKGKLEEAYIYTAKMMAMFNSIQGFEYEIETCLTIEEAFGVIGISLPA
ncbi:MAG: hypothetical protein WA974_13355 [Thermodesulfobacteriota bacterium]